eukprot:COSAG06_NODE_6943_length_2704_cov_7.914377_2_plen_146_part_00
MWTQQLRQALGRRYQQGADDDEDEEEEARARALYAEGSLSSPSIDDKWWQTIDLITDTEFGCPTLRLAESLSAHATGDEEESSGGVQVRTPIKLSTDVRIKLSTERASIAQVYQFNQRSRYSRAPPRWGVYHASELQYLLRSTLV